MAHPFQQQILNELLPLSVDGDRTVRVGQNEVELRRYRLADLVITSGRLMACDPLWLDEHTPMFAVPVIPGPHSIVLTIAQHIPGEDRPAFATLYFQNRRPIRWEVATFDDVSTSALGEDDIVGYPVDTGIGCFMDVDAARVLQRRMRDDAQYHLAVAQQMNENDPAGVGWSWGVLTFEPTIKANVVFFTAGEGDGT